MALNFAATILRNPAKLRGHGQTSLFDTLVRLFKDPTDADASTGFA
jgi:hypothetical protein